MEIKQERNLESKKCFEKKYKLKTPFAKKVEVINVRQNVSEKKLISLLHNNIFENAKVLE